MSNYIFFSFLFFLFFDLFQIYALLDSKILLNNYGNKLNQVLTINSNKKNNKEVNSDKLRNILLYVIITIFLSLTINLIFNYIIYNYPIYFTLFKKTIELKSFLDESFQTFKLAYYISSIIFSILLSCRISKHIQNILNKFNISGKEHLESLKTIKRQGIKVKDELTNSRIFIPKESLYKNILITGSIGCGKTTGAISNITYELIKNKMGGLILDAKGNFVNIIEKQVSILKRESDLKIISLDSELYIDILDNNISNLELASILKKVITILTLNNVSDSYFLDKVENTLFNLLILISFIDKKEILEIHRIITNENYLHEVIAKVKEKALTTNISDKDSYEITRAIDFFLNEYLKLDVRTISIIKSEITRLTIPLITDFNIYNKLFNKQKVDKKINFDNLSDIIVLSINIGKNKEICKILATIIKLMYQKKVLENINSPIDTFIIIDEFQEFVNEEDAYFLSLSRESKCINLISTQSYTSLSNSLRNKDVANVIIQNLVNKIWFRNDDIKTVKDIVEFLGKKDVIKKTHTYTENGNVTTKRLFKNEFRNIKSGLSEGINISKIKENEYFDNFFTRELKTFEALMFYINEDEETDIKKIKFERWQNDEKI